MGIFPHILPPPASVSDSYAVHDLHERLAHGRQLKIYLPKSAEKLEFTPADEPGKTFRYWEKGTSRSDTRDGDGGKLWAASGVVTVDVSPCGCCSVPYRMTRGRVSGTGSDRRWYIDKVNKDIWLKSK